MESIIDQEKHAGQGGGMQPMGHIGREQFLKCRAGGLTREEAAEMLGHAADCEDCALLLAESLPEYELLTPRANLKSEILKKAGESGENAIRAQERFSTRFQMLTYSLKVGTAVAAALIFLFSLNPNPGAPLMEAPDPGQTFTGKLNRITQEISSSALDASNRLVSGEFDILWNDDRIGGEKE